MADVSVYFFWPGLIISILLSILLTIGLNVRIWRRSADRELNNFENGNRNGFENGSRNGFEDGGWNGFEDGGRSGFNENNNTNRRETIYDFEEPAESRSETSGMVLIGPIPIIFSGGRFRLDKRIFKYTLLLFIIVILIWQILVQTACL